MTDSDFPAGTLPSVAVQCPYCGEPIELQVEAGGDARRYVEDCPVCCRPIEVHVDGQAPGEEGVRPNVRVATDNEA